MSIRTKIIQPRPEHEQLRLALCSCIRRLNAPGGTA